MPPTKRNCFTKNEYSDWNLILVIDIAILPLQLGKSPYPLIHRPHVLSERGIDGFLHVQFPLIWTHISLVENSGWHKHSETIIGNYSEVMISDILKVSIFVYILVIQVRNSKIDFNMEALSMSCRNKHWSQYFIRILIIVISIYFCSSCRVPPG